MLRTGLHVAAVPLFHRLEWRHREEEEVPLSPAGSWHACALPGIAAGWGQRVHGPVL